MQIARKLGVGVAVVGSAATAAAHTAGTITRSSAERTWSFEPSVVIPLMLAAGLFIAGALRRRKRPGWSGAQLGFFVAGWLTLVIALVSPVHKLGALLFSVHMTQHELLMIIAAPLLVLSQPLLWFLWAVPMRWREAIGGWAKQPTIAALWSA